MGPTPRPSYQNNKGGPKMPAGGVVMLGLASSVGRGVPFGTSVLAILLALGAGSPSRAQTPSVEAVDDTFTISHDAVAIRQSLAQTAPNVQSNDENVPVTAVALRVTTAPRCGRLDRFDERVGSFVYTPNYNGADPALRRWDGTDRFIYTIYVGGQAVSSASVTIGTRYDGYTYFLDPEGDSGDIATQSRGGLLLAGGSDRMRRADKVSTPWLEAAFLWLIGHANGGIAWDNAKTSAQNRDRGGDAVVLRASPYLNDDAALMIREVAERNHTPLNSVETLIFDPTDLRAARLAADGRVGTALDKLRQAEAVFFGGGDQFVYFAVWGDTQFLSALDEKYRSGRTVLGGSSAGMHVLGGLSYVNEPNPNTKPNQAAGLGGLTSVRAIRDPAGAPMNLRDGFLASSWARELRVLTDTHFGQRQTGDEVPANLRGRMGRLVALLARLHAGHPGNTFRGLAADEATAVLVEASGDRKSQGTVVGKGSAYLLTTPKQPPRLSGGSSANGQPAPLGFGPVQVYRLDGREAFEPAALNFDFAAWRPVAGGILYTIAAEGGSLNNLSDATRDVYNNPKR
jgi:cyanophycinase-like exopeptidase